MTLSAELQTLSLHERRLWRQAVHLWNDTNDHYPCHDLFEELWGEDFWKGLVQAAVALHHYGVGNIAGIEGLPANVDRILRPFEPRYMGLDVVRFRREFAAYFSRIEAGERPAVKDAPRLHVDVGVLAWLDAAAAEPDA